MILIYAFLLDNAYVPLLNSYVVNVLYYWKYNRARNVAYVEGILGIFL